MTAHFVQATPDVAGSAPGRAKPEEADERSRQRVTATQPGRSCTLDLSRLRTHNAVLDILKAYKLTGNFHDNLGVVLRDMGVSGLVAYEVEPHPALAFPDCRHVVFRLSASASSDAFDGVMRSISDRVGFHPPWWMRLCAPTMKARAAFWR